MFQNKKSKNNIEKPSPVSYYAGIYGKGEEAKMNFAFKLIPTCITAMCVAIAMVFTAHFLLLHFTGNGIELLSVLGVVAPIFSMPLTFTLGYLYGKPAEK